jgi:hypothetical protein
MQAIEITGKIDNKGHLILDGPLKLKEKKVKVIILLAEEKDEDEEKLWLYSVSNNPAFNFLKEKEEDIYSLKDGKAIKH